MQALFRDGCRCHAARIMCGNAHMLSVLGHKAAVHLACRRSPGRTCVVPTDMSAVLQLIEWCALLAVQAAARHTSESRSDYCCPGVPQCNARGPSCCQVAVGVHHNISSMQLKRGWLCCRVALAPVCVLCVVQVCRASCRPAGAWFSSVRARVHLRGRPLCTLTAPLMSSTRDTWRY